MATPIPWEPMLAAGCILLVVAIWLLKTGWWPRRRGDVPFCAACGYLLIGNQSGRCPECGSDLAQPGRIRHGERHRRPGRALAGVLVGIAALALLGLTTRIAVSQIDWYRYRPLAWLLDDLQTQPPARAGRAWRELTRRRADLALAAGIEERLAAVALQEQGKAAPGPMVSLLVNFLGERYVAGKLTPQQSDLFFAQATRVAVSIRPVVVVGDYVPYEVAVVGRRPANWICEQRIESVKVGDRIVKSGAAGYPSSTRLRGGFKAEDPGRHAVRFVGRVEFKARETPYHGSGPLLAYRDITAEAATEVLERGGSAPVKQFDDPWLQAQIKSALGVQWTAYSGTGQTVFRITVGRSPANMAFDIIARVEGREYPLGSTLAVGKGGSGFFGATEPREGFPGTGLPGARVDLILRSSESAARQTVDLFEIWKGEIVFEWLQLP